MCFCFRTSFPVLLQPVKPGHVGGGGNKCVRFTLVAAPRVKNVTYIKVRQRLESTLFSD